MKTKILLTIIATIFLAGLIVAGGVLLNDRASTISQADKNILIANNITDITVSKLDCSYSDYCTYNVYKENIFDKRDNRIEKYKQVCTTSKMEGVDITNCVKTLKTDAELEAERDKQVDNLQSTLAGQLSTAKASVKIVGTDQRVVIGGKE